MASFDQGQIFLCFPQHRFIVDCAFTNLQRRCTNTISVTYLDGRYSRCICCGCIYGDLVSGHFMAYSVIAISQCYIVN